MESGAPNQKSKEESGSRAAASRGFFYGIVGTLSCGLVAFSQIAAFQKDEGFHLLAAQLVNAGRKPYLDFFYQHTPLYIYLAGGWMKLFGESWRTAHVMSALLTGGYILLVGQFVRSRLGETDWRLAGGTAAGVLAGLHVSVIRFATIGHPYGLLLFAEVAAFRAALRSAQSDRGSAAFWAGLFAGAGPASSLLSAPAAPIFLLWILRHSQPGTRVRKGAWFLAGGVVPFTPLLWLAAKAPRQLYLDVVQFHLRYRMLDLSYAPHRDLRIAINWLTSSQGMCLAVLAAAGLVYLAIEKPWAAAQRAEFQLAGWLAAGLGMYLVTARPTLFEYFVLVVPFLSILAVLGIRAISVAISIPARPGWLVVGILLVFAFPPARWLYESSRTSLYGWREMEQVANKVSRVTPPGAWIWAEPVIYFASRRLPPPGMENDFAAAPNALAGFGAVLHPIPRPQIDNWLVTGRFATVVMPIEDPRAQSPWLYRLYSHREQAADYYVFWEGTPSLSLARLPAAGFLDHSDASLLIRSNPLETQPTSSGACHPGVLSRCRSVRGRLRKKSRKNSPKFVRLKKL